MENSSATLRAPVEFQISLAKVLAKPPLSFILKIKLMSTYRGGVNTWVKCSVCFILKFALPPFSPPLPSGMQISKQNMH